MSSYPKVWLLRLLCCALLLAGSMAVFAQNTPEEDDFLQLLRTELKQQYDSLQRTNLPPYFLAYRVNESTKHQITANFGYIYDKSVIKTTFLTIELRVGAPETDNYHFLTNKNTLVKQIPLPLDGNTASIKKIVRQETRKAYQEAVIQYIGNTVDETWLVGENDYEKFPYARQGMDGYYEPPALESHWDEPLWERSLAYGTNGPNIDATEFSAKLVYQTSRKYLVNSENSYFAGNNSSAMLTLRVEGTTLDNTPEHIERQYFAYYPEQLPDKEVLRTEMEEMENLLGNVLVAEKCDLSHSPVLLSPHASAVLIHNLLGHDLENPDNSWLRNRMWRQVMPASFSVYSDPTLAPIRGTYPGGSYVFDDEGINSQRVQHIDHGEFRQFLSSRTQQPHAFKSNGNARGNRRLPSPRLSNLVLESDRTLDRDELFKQLHQLNKDEDYALYVAEVEVRCDTNEVVSLYPTVCYKIHADHRKPDEIVRDIVLKGTKQQWLGNLTAAGNGSSSVAMACHSQQDVLLTNSASPALLFRDAEVCQQVKTPRFRIVKEEITSGSSEPMSTADIFRLSAQNEWDNDVKSLKIGEETAPYYEEFLMTDAHLFTVEASEGSVLYANEKPVRKLVPRLLLGSDSFNNENMADTPASPASYPLPISPSFFTFSKDFSLAAGTEYQKAVKQLKTKQLLIPVRKKSDQPDRSSSPATQSDNERVPDLPTMNNLQHLAQEASAALAQQDFLSRSGANLYIMMGNTYFWNSENTTYSRPLSLIALQIYGTVGKKDGEAHTDGRTFFFPFTDSLFSIQHIEKEIDIVVSHLKKVKEDGLSFEGCYSGPVLIEGEAVGQLLVSSLLETKPNLLSYREPLLASASDKVSFEDRLDKIITSKKISVMAGKSGDTFGQATFARHESTDAEGVETQETEIIRNGKLIALLGNRTVTKSTPYSNGFQQTAINQEASFGTRGAARLDFSYKTTVPHNKLKGQLLKEAKRQGLPYAYIIRRLYDHTLQNFTDLSNAKGTPILQLYRVDVRTGKETPVTGASLSSCDFFVLDRITAASNENAAYPVMAGVPGATGSRDFPFAGVPTCLVAPDGLLLKSSFIVRF